MSEALRAPLQCPGHSVLNHYRHTLSHNGGLVTGSDSTKLKVLGYDAPINEVIDPTQNRLGETISAVLRSEATDFTDWLRKNTIKCLQGVT